MSQLPLFPMDNFDPPDNVPDPLTLLRNGAALVLSVSGGKDSDAMCHHLLDLRQTEGWSGDVMMVHADLGARVEWQQLVKKSNFRLKSKHKPSNQAVTGVLPISMTTMFGYWIC